MRLVRSPNSSSSNKLLGISSIGGSNHNNNGMMQKWRWSFFVLFFIAISVSYSQQSYYSATLLLSLDEAEASSSSSAEATTTSTDQLPEQEDPAVTEHWQPEEPSADAEEGEDEQEEDMEVADDQQPQPLQQRQRQPQSTTSFHSSSASSNPHLATFEVHDFSAAAANLNEFLDGPAAPIMTSKRTTSSTSTSNPDQQQQLIFPMINETHAVCDFQKAHKSNHFPHTMQQLYRCFSWWQANPHQKPVLLLVFPEMPSRYIAGFVDTLRQVFGVQTVFRLPHNYEQRHALQSVAVKPTTQTKDVNGTLLFYQMHPGDADILRDKTLRYYNWTTTNAGGCDAAIPTIGFLNRRGSRHVKGEKALIKAIQQEFPNSPPIKYVDAFDGKSFQEQIKFMSSVDVLFGPHGAQLTSLAYLPRCGGLLELFPTGFYYPSYFGTLATASQHYHAGLYTGNQTSRQQEMSKYMKKGQRFKARGFPITIKDPTQVIAALKHLMEQRQSCCQRYQQQQQQQQLQQQ